MIKNLLRVLLVVAILLALAFVGLVYLVNPNQYRGAIEQAVFESTGYELIIAGDLDLQFSPYFALTLNDVRLRNPALPQELASTTQIALRINPQRLLERELLIYEFRADDFHINYFTDADARNNWDLQSSAPDSASAINTAVAATSAAPTTNTSSIPDDSSSSFNSDGAIRTSLERILVNNASVDIQNLSTGSRYSINNLDFEGQRANLDGQSFPVILDFTFLNSGISEPLAMGIRSNVAFSQSAGTLQLTDINFNLTPLLIRGQLAVTGLNDALAYEGSLESNEFALTDFLKTLNPAPLASDLPAVSAEPPVVISIAFSGDREQLSVSRATFSVADTLMQANANIRMATDFEPTSISYDITSNTLDLTPFMAASESSSGASDPQAEATATAIPRADESAQAQVPDAPTTAPTDSPLPLELLNSFNLLGSISIESIVLNSLAFNDITVFTNLEDGVLDIESQPISTMEGTLLGNLRLDARGEVGDLTTQLAINQINIGAMTPVIARLDSITGRLNLQAQHTAQGTTPTGLLDSLNGTTQFAITDNSVNIGIIKQVFTAISALSTSGETVQQWPDELSFQELSGYVVLENGITENQQVKLRLDNFDVTGTGGIDLNAGAFEYDLLFTVLGEPYIQTIQISPRYHDISWPVSCSASFNDDVTQFCRPDFAQVREIFTQMGTNEVRRRLDDVVNDQVPTQLQDTARGLLRNFLN